jgi:hypothetical protein
MSLSEVSSRVTLEFNQVMHGVMKMLSKKEIAAILNAGY